MSSLLETHGAYTGRAATPMPKAKRSPRPSVREKLESMISSLETEEKEYQRLLAEEKKDTLKNQLFPLILLRRYGILFLPLITGLVVEFCTSLPSRLWVIWGLLQFLFIIIAVAFGCNDMFFSESCSDLAAKLAESLAFDQQIRDSRRFRKETLTANTRYRVSKLKLLQDIHENPALLGKASIEELLKEIRG